MQSNPLGAFSLLSHLTVLPYGQLVAEEKGRSGLIALSVLLHLPLALQSPISFSPLRIFRCDHPGSRFVAASPKPLNPYRGPTSQQGDNPRPRLKLVSVSRSQPGDEKCQGCQRPQNECAKSPWMKTCQRCLAFKASTPFFEPFQSSPVLPARRHEATGRTTVAQEIAHHPKDGFLTNALGAVKVPPDEFGLPLPQVQRLEGKEKHCYAAPRVLRDHHGGANFDVFFCNPWKGVLSEPDAYAPTRVISPDIETLPRVLAARHLGCMLQSSAQLVGNDGPTRASVEALFQCALACMPLTSDHVRHECALFGLVVFQSVLMSRHPASPLVRSGHPSGAHRPG
jgi:hypothetical protein